MDALRTVQTEGNQAFLNQEADALREGRPLPTRAQTDQQESFDLKINPITYSEEQYAGENLVQWELQDRSQNRVNNDEVLDTVAKPFNLAENIYNQRMQDPSKDRALRLNEKSSSDVDADRFQGKPIADAMEEHRFSGQPISALIENGSAALKLNVHELTGAEE